MPNTYAQIYLQIVFAVKGRRNLIPENHREEIQKFMSGIIANRKQKLYAIFCMPDHVHILVSIKPDISISDLVRDVKSNSTKFINERKFSPTKFEWQSGFGVFSYSQSSLKNVTQYVLNQPEHHGKKKFSDEYISLLQYYDVEYDPQYLFEFYE